MNVNIKDYRPLKEGEIIEEGDVFNVWGSIPIEWAYVGFSIGCKFSRELFTSIYRKNTVTKKGNKIVQT